MKWINEKRKLKDLIPNAKNPRRMSKRMAEKLGESIDLFGIASPLVVNIDGQLIGGHQRVKQLLAMGFDEIDVRIPPRELTQDECDLLNIMLNKVNGEWNDEMLANLWDEELLLKGGFTEAELCIDTPLDTEDTKQCTITIKFDDSKHLKTAEDAIAAIIDLYDGATYKVKIK